MYMDAYYIIQLFPIILNIFNWPQDKENKEEKRIS